MLQNILEGQIKQQEPKQDVMGYSWYNTFLHSLHFQSCCFCLLLKMQGKIVLTIVISLGYHFIGNQESYTGDLSCRVRTVFWQKTYTFSSVILLLCHMPRRGRLFRMERMHKKKKKICNPGVDTWKKVQSLGQQKVKGRKEERNDD